MVRVSRDIGLPRVCGNGLMLSSLCVNGAQIAPSDRSSPVGSTMGGMGGVELDGDRDGTTVGMGYVGRVCPSSYVVS